MRIHVFEHADIEGIGTIADIASARSWPITRTAWHLGQDAPAESSWDLLLVMGGPMNIYEEEAYPWLTQEKAALDRALAANKPVLGICLGAQLLADRLGGPVVRNPWREIGWSELDVAAALRQAGELLEGWPARPRVFQWHGDTFILPPDATSIGSTVACQNQGFVHGQAVALQFHLELSEPHLRGLIEAEDDFTGPHVQTPEQFLSQVDDFRENRRLLESLLDRLARRVAASR